jgi:hypothetical protein
LVEYYRCGEVVVGTARRFNGFVLFPLMEEKPTSDGHRILKLSYDYTKELCCR